MNWSIEKPLIETENRLANEKSPYLLQHKTNPVNWFPWGEEAFRKAREKDKPVFLSIGYSTCHWCHVMAHESFEDDEVATLLNENMISIKVDREERPDIDRVYMKVCQLMTGGGGWPLTIIMTPDKKPFYSATYIPKKPRFGMPGMTQLIPQIAALWKDRREEALRAAGEIERAMVGGETGAGEAGVAAATQAAVMSSAGASSTFHSEILEKGYRQLANRFDPRRGGFGDAPKFPSPHNLLFLLHQWKREGGGNGDGKDEGKNGRITNKTLQMVETTLRAMRNGGIYDHLGGGFHRYATDREWLVPHFEKMLYDQALLIMAYTAAFRVTGKEEYRRTAKETIQYVLRDMTDSGGGFHSAEDADSEGVEGKFYVWTEEEIVDVLGSEDATLFSKVYNVKKEGSFRDEATGRSTGKNILHLERPLAEVLAGIAKEEGGAAGDELAEHPVERLEKRLEEMRGKLFAVREKRIRPHLDDKVLTDWNGLMIAALAGAACAFDQPRYAAAARGALDFILSEMRDDNGRLLHRYRDGEAAIGANLDDYAFLVWGLLELYQATFDVGLLEIAKELIGDMVVHFTDRERGGFFFTPDDGEELMVRSREIYDGAIPSGNAVAVHNLLRLARITGNVEFEEAASTAIGAFSGDLEKMPSAYTQFLVTLDFAMGPTHEIVVAGKKDSEDTKEMLLALRQAFVPNAVVLFRDVGSKDKIKSITSIAEFTRDMAIVDGKATAYVCTDHRCNLPTTDVDRMLELLDAAAGWE